MTALKCLELLLLAATFSMNETKIPFNGVLYGVSQFGLIIGTIPGLPWLVKGILIGPVGWISYHLITNTTTGDLAVDVAMGSAILTQLMIGLDNMFLSHPNTLKNHQDPPQAKKITDQQFLPRLRWAFNLYTNPRGIGWSHEPPNLPKRPPSSTQRWNFVFFRTVTAGLCALVEFVGYVSNASNPGMTTPGQVLSDFPLHWRVLGVAGFVAAGAARINAMNCVLSAVIVGLGLSQPVMWPNLFGSPLDAWSVQRVWRRIWHQLLRKSLLACTQFIATKILRRPPIISRTLDKLIWLYTAFFIIGVVHVGGEYMLLGRPGAGAFTFFMLQAVGISLEKLVVFIWTNGARAPSSSKPRFWVRCVGYIWVLVWFGWCVPFMVDPMVTSGMFVDRRFDLRGFPGY